MCFYKHNVGTKPNEHCRPRAELDHNVQNFENMQIDGYVATLYEILDRQNIRERSI